MHNLSHTEACTIYDYVWKKYICWKSSCAHAILKFAGDLKIAKIVLRFLCPRHSKNGGGALSVTPVRASVCPSVRASVIKIWCPLNNFWKTTSIQFRFGILIYNIKTQVEFKLGNNPLILDRVMGLL